MLELRRMIYIYLSRPHGLRNLALTSMQLAIEVQDRIYEHINLNLPRESQVLFFGRIPTLGPLYAVQP
jgi:hypothetical protein